MSGFAFQIVSAQVKVGFSVNIGTQPEWGPVGYDHVEYYYLPGGYKDRHDQEIIRNSNDSKYIKNKNNPGHRVWRQSSRRYRNGRNR